MATRGRRGQVRMMQRWWTEDGLGRGCGRDGGCSRQTGGEAMLEKAMCGETYKVGNVSEREEY
jgi:hypothetical protein